MGTPKCDRAAIEEYARLHPEARQHEIARQFGLAQATVSTILQPLGLTFPERGGRATQFATCVHSTNARIRHERIAGILRENRDSPYHDVAQLAGCDRETVRLVAKEFGLERVIHLYRSNPVAGNAAHRAKAQLRRDSMIKFLSENPQLTYKVVAKQTGYSRSYVEKIAITLGIRRKRCGGSPHPYHRPRRVPVPIPKATKEEIEQWEAILTAEGLSKHRGADICYGRELDINGDVARRRDGSPTVW